MPASPPSRAGCIPASAGESSSAWLITAVVRVHPRERGGIPNTSPLRDFSGGASPRARGNLWQEAADAIAKRCIPASAGESTVAGMDDATCRVHPRERGGIEARLQTAIYAQGASPRARGNPVSDVLRPLPTGCIPASAGESIGCARCGLTKRVHPRERGGIAVSLVEPFLVSGASPRARGNLERRLLPVGQRGCIPASAGESAASSAASRRYWVHPRERGGIMAARGQNAQCTGASPRARGNP